jgi:hypothetical protein
MRNHDDWLEEPFQDAEDLANKMVEVEDQYLASHDYKMDYLAWKDGDESATEQHYMASTKYEYNLENYANKVQPPEEMDF